MTEAVVERLQVVREQIADACRRADRAPEEVRLLAVSKRQPDDLLRAAFEAGGQIDFGENYVQELVRKQALLPDARFHMIGHVQTNKAKKAASAAVVHTVDTPKLARALAKGVAPGRQLEVLVEVNLAEEPQKAGVGPDGVEAVLDAIRELDALTPRGLMCIPPAEGVPQPWFARLRELRARLRAATGLELPELSMGMSADFESAVLEGATMVRVGTRVFGPRAP